MPTAIIPKPEEIVNHLRELKRRRGELQAQQATAEDCPDPTPTPSEGAIKKILGQFYRGGKAVPKPTVDRAAIVLELDEVEEALARLRPLYAEAQAVEREQLKDSLMPAYRQAVQKLNTLLDQAVEQNCQVESLESRMGSSPSRSFRALQKRWSHDNEGILQYKEKVVLSGILDAEER